MKGDFTPGKTVNIGFNTHKADGTPITLTGGVISVYKKGNAAESTAGVTLSTDYDSRTGYHNVAIDTSADGAFYAAGNDFDIVLTTGTVDSISVVGTKVGEFSLSNRSALRPATADRTIAVDGSGNAPATIAVGSIANGAITPAALDDATATKIANAVETQIIDDTDAEKVLEAVVNKINAMTDLDALTLAAISAAVRSELAIELARLDVAISSRLATAGYTVPPTANENAAAWGSGGSIDGHTRDGQMKVVLAAAAGRTLGMETANGQVRAANDSKTRITVTMDGNNRTATTLDSAG